MKTKILLWGFVLVLITGLAAGAYWRQHRPQIIVLDNGDKLTLLGVTYGKHHAPPAEKKKPAAGARRGQGPQAFNTANNALVVWIRQEHPASQWPNYQLYLYDKANTACTGSSGNRSSYGGGTNEVVAAEFDSFPRRQGSLILRIQEWGQGGQMMNEKHFVVSNPARGPFEKWQPEPLPATKTDDDFSVTLTKLVAGADLPYQRNQEDADDAMNKGMAATFTVQRNGGPVANWQLVSVESSDATGNHASSSGIQNTWQGDNDSVTYQAGLWADESAWKLRAEFSQQSDFASNELWSASAIPLEPGRQQDYWNFANNFFNNRRSITNRAVAETDLGGVHLKIFAAKQFTDQQMGNGEIDGGVHIQATPSLPAGMQITLVKVTDNQGGEIQSNGSGTSGNGTSTIYSYQLRDLGGLTNLNVTIAIHKSHFFEFTVKPEKEKP
jgi:hypothetical protein